MPAASGNCFVKCCRALASAWWRNKLAKAEAELGRSGWQTCDFGEECEDMLRRLDATERLQIDLINRRAACARETAEIEAAITNSTKIIDEARTELASIGDSFIQETRKTTVELDEARQKAARFRIAVAALDGELSGMATSKQSPRPEWQVRIELSEAEARLEDEVQTAARSEAELNLATQARERASTDPSQRAHDAENLLTTLHSSLQIARKAHAEAERAILKAERAKSVPYRRLGTVMADAGLGSPNQPALLETVLALRKKMNRPGRIISSRPAG